MGNKGIALADFAGDWSLSRRIEGSDGTGQFEGRARFVPDAAGLTYDEAGTLTLGDASFAAHRRYLWRTAGGRIAVLFADGRAFHDFAPDAPAAVHLCGADTYGVAYDFTRWPDWQARWRVTGPRKDYVMTSCYTPLAGAETAGNGTAEGPDPWPSR